MNLTAEMLPAAWLWPTHLILAVLLFGLLRATPWQWLHERTFLHLLAGCTVLLLILWSVRATSMGGLHYHFLGAALFTLMFGWAYAMVALTVVVFGATAYGLGDWSTVSLNALLLAVMPVYLAHSLLRVLERRLPHHFFIYVFGNGFFGAAAITAVTVVASALIPVLAGSQPWDRVFDHFLAYTPFMMFGEGFVTGMVITMLVVFRPDWVVTFSDERYIKGK